MFGIEILNSIHSGRNPPSDLAVVFTYCSCFLIPLLGKLSCEKSETVLYSHLLELRNEIDTVRENLESER